MALQNYILIFESILLLLLAFYVWLRNPKNPICISFFVMVLGAAVWVLFIALSEEYITSFNNKSTFTGALLIVAGFIYFAQLFPYKSYIIKKWLNYLIIVPALILLVLLYATELFIKDGLNEDNNFIEVGIFYYVFVVYFLSLWIWGTVTLFQKYKRSDGLHHRHLKNMLFALTLTFIFGILLNILLPLIFQIAVPQWIAPMLSIILFGSASYILFKKQV